MKNSWATKEKYCSSIISRSFQASTFWTFLRGRSSIFKNGAFFSRTKRNFLSRDVSTLPTLSTHAKLQSNQILQQLSFLEPVFVDLLGVLGSQGSARLPWKMEIFSHLQNFFSWHNLQHWRERQCVKERKLQFFCCDMWGSLHFFG